MCCWVPASPLCGLLPANLAGLTKLIAPSCCTLLTANKIASQPSRQTYGEPAFMPLWLPYCGLRSNTCILFETCPMPASYLLFLARVWQATNAPPANPAVLQDPRARQHSQATATPPLATQHLAERAQQPSATPGTRANRCGTPSHMHTCCYHHTNRGRYTVAAGDRPFNTRATCC